MTAFLPTPRETVSALASSAIRDIANAGIGRTDIAAFWFGESDLPTPGFIVEAARESLARGETFYTHNFGTAALRQAIADYSATLHARPLSPDRVAVTGSGVSALMLAAQLILSPGDKVVVVTPIWPNIAEIPKILGAEVIRHPLTVSDGRWRLDIERLIETLTPDITMLVINAPNNPTGFTLDTETQKVLLAHCRTLGIWVLSDEVYERLMFNGGPTAPSMRSHAEPDDRLMLVNSFSKAWRMTGWRIGWLTLPDALMPGLAKIIEYNTSCVPAFVQAGALAALTDPRGEDAVATLHDDLSVARAALLTGFEQLGGVTCPEADGAMYAFFRIESEPDDMALARRLVADYGLGLAPGSAFGPEGRGWLRWCFATRPEKIGDGLDRLSRALGRAGA